MSFHKSRDHAFSLDEQDTLGQYRNQFYLPKHSDGTAQIYFCGNSLGLQPKATRVFIAEIMDSWAQNAVNGHFAGSHPWFSYHEFLTEKLARLVGADPLEVVAMNSLTVNLHLMMVSFYRPTRERYKILIEKYAFPSDRYAVLSQLKFHGLNPRQSLIEAAPREGESIIRKEDLMAIIDGEGDRIALILLPGVQYYTGQAFDLEQVTRFGHRKGCVVGLDLAHAAGNLTLRLHDWGVDFAVWCSYKYLNAGPGAVGGCFVHEQHSRRIDLPRFAGWWGHDKDSRFQMPDRFSVLPGAEGWQLSNPPILSMAPLLASLQLFDEAGLDTLRSKSEKLTAYLEFLLNEQCSGKLSIITPQSLKERGSQLSITLVDKQRDAKAIHEKLKGAGVICDWREPDVIRVAPVPLYNRFSEVFEFVNILHSIL